MPHFDEIDGIPRMVERIVEADEIAEIGAMTMMLYGLPRPEGVDAITVYPGLGEHWRVEQAVDAWEANPRTNNLLVAGTNPEEKTQIKLTMDALVDEPFNLRRTVGVHTQVAAANTPGQADWVAEKIKDLDIRTMSLYVSPYHLLRAYCTTLKTLEKHDIRIPIIPMPIRMSPDTIIPETGATPVEMFNGEVKRIKTYQPKGDVATLPELEDYLGWLWKQPILSAR